jgi:hypothetical protein
MSIDDHPGFMEYDGRFPEVLHADWPIYPGGHGWQVALQSLAVFPSRVRFKKIDDIDRCYLLVIIGSGPCLQPKQPLSDTRWFHVALWHRDLLELRRRGLISGVTLRTEYERALDHYERHKDLVVKIDGQFRPLDMPRPERDDYEYDNPTVPEITADGITLTSSGREILASLARPLSELQAGIRERVEPLLSISSYDTAIRETAIILESRLREITGSDLFGQALVEEYYKRLCLRNQNNPRAIFKVLRGELRTVFKFVRNDFAHAIHEITDSQCRILLDRISLTLEKINEIEAVESGTGE